MSELHYVYRHIRPDKNEVFYIGIGKHGTGRHLQKRRNGIWEKIVSKNNGVFIAEIMMDSLTEDEALLKEKEFISLYGKLKDGTGTLSNILDYGSKGHHIGRTEEEKENLRRFNKTRVHKKGWKLTEETKLRMSLSRRGVPKKRGYTISPEHVTRLREANKGNISNTGKILINNGITSKFIYKEAEIPNGWIRGGLPKRKMSNLTRQKMSRSKKGKKLNLSDEERLNRKLRGGNSSGSAGKIWITDGVTSKYIPSEDPIPTGWKPGRTLGKRKK